MTWDFFLTLRGTQDLYLNQVSHSDPLKVMGLVVGWLVVVVAHKDLETEQRPIPLSLLDLNCKDWGLGLGLVN